MFSILINGGQYSYFKRFHIPLPCHISASGISDGQWHFSWHAPLFSFSQGIALCWILKDLACLCVKCVLHSDTSRRLSLVFWLGECADMCELKMSFLPMHVSLKLSLFTIPPPPPPQQTHSPTPSLKPGSLSSDTVCLRQMRTKCTVFTEKMSIHRKHMEVFVHLHTQHTFLWGNPSLTGGVF